MHVKTTFLNGYLEEKIYMSLYGLEQAPNQAMTQKVW